MTTPYPQRIEQARQDLAALEADARDLARLRDERAVSIEEMRAANSRDFARMAELEGQRAALVTMLSDQEAEIAQTRQGLKALEPLLRPFLDADSKWSAAHAEWLRIGSELGVSLHRFSGPEAEPTG
ncbi:hypothetical protein ACTQ9L_16285 [Deinococcus wulumuqiensis]